MIKTTGSSIEKEMEKRKEALKARLGSINKNNPVVAHALKQQDPKKDVHTAFSVVDALVSAARDKYEITDDLPSIMLNLGKAIIDAAKNPKKKPLDTEENKLDDSED